MEECLVFCPGALEFSFTSLCRPKAIDRLLDLKASEDGEILLLPEPIAEGDAVTFDSRGVGISRGAMRADCGSHYGWIT